MQGGEGDDIYFVGEAGDTIVEFDGQGKDTINTLVDNFNLGTAANVENLTLLGGAGVFNATGSGFST